MANVDRPNGAKAVDSLTGSPISGKLREYTVDASVNTTNPIFPGDFVTLDADSGTVIAVTGVTQEVLGVCAGVIPVNSVPADGFMSNSSLAETEYPGYIAASKDGKVLVNVDPNQIYEVQEDSTGSNLAAENVGETVDITPTVGSTTTGRSAHELDSSSVGQSQQLLIHGLATTPDNAVGTNAKWYVSIARHVFDNQVVGQSS